MNANNYTTLITTNTQTNAQRNLVETKLQEVPSLSRSIDSLPDDETANLHPISAPLDIRSKIHPSHTSTNRHGRHIYDGGIWKLDVPIVKDTASRLGPSRTFSSSPALKKKTARFALGGSCHSSEHSPGIERIKFTAAAAGKKPIFQVRASSGEDSLKSSVHFALPSAPISNLTAQALQQGQQQSESAVYSDSEPEYVDESAIDDDDSSDWESASDPNDVDENAINDDDSAKGSRKSRVDDKFFQRVELKANLASRPSIITLMLAHNERASTLGNQASQSTPAIHRTRAAPNGPNLCASPNDSDEAPLMMKGMRHSALKPISEIPRPSAQPITTHANHVNLPAAFSPRTTRRNMLATELTESLRLNLIWERQQKKLASKAMLKRRGPSQHVANLKQVPQKVHIKTSENKEAHSWNLYFSKGALNGYHLNGYHSKGW